MKTRERILQNSLLLFNEHGETNITTNHIANEMDISPGNLYYYFRNKDEIIYQLFLEFEQQISASLEPPSSRMPTLEDMWLYLHLIFENIWKYRFLYRDLDNLISRNRKLHSHFKRVIDRSINTAISICNGLVESGAMHATRDEIEALAINITVIATYWLNFQHIRGRPSDKESQYFARGTYQVISLVTPYMKGNSQELLSKLSRVYLE